MFEEYNSTKDGFNAHGYNEFMSLTTKMLCKAWSKMTSFLTLVRKATSFSNESIVKLNYNDYGYNEFTSITNKLWSIAWFQMTSLLHKCSRLKRSHGYNEQIWIVQ